MLHSEAFKEKTLSREEFEGLVSFQQNEYLRMYIPYREMEQFKESIFQRSLDQIAEIYNKWALRLYQKRIVAAFKEKMMRTDSVEQQVYEKEIKILLSTKSMEEIHTRFLTFPHIQEIIDQEKKYSIWGEYTVRGQRNIRLEKNHELSFISIREPSASIPYVAGGTWSDVYLANFDTFLTREEYLYFNAFEPFAYFRSGSRKNGDDFCRRILLHENAAQIKSIDPSNTNPQESIYINSCDKEDYLNSQGALFYCSFPCLWNEYCDQQYRKLYQLDKHNEIPIDEKHSSFLEFLNSPDDDLQDSKDDWGPIHF